MDIDTHPDRTTPEGTFTAEAKDTTSKEETGGGAMDDTQTRDEGITPPSGGTSHANGQLSPIDGRHTLMNTNITPTIITRSRSTTPINIGMQDAPMVMSMKGSRVEGGEPINMEESQLADGITSRKKKIEQRWKRKTRWKHRKQRSRKRK